MAIGSIEATISLAPNVTYTVCLPSSITTYLKSESLVSLYNSDALLGQRSVNNNMLRFLEKPFVHCYDSSLNSIWNVSYYVYKSMCICVVYSFYKPIYTLYLRLRPPMPGDLNRTREQNPLYSDSLIRGYNMAARILFSANSAFIDPNLPALSDSGGDNRPPGRPPRRVLPFLLKKRFLTIQALNLFINMLLLTVYYFLTVKYVVCLPIDNIVSWIEITQRLITNIIQKFCNYFIGSATAFLNVYS